MRKVTKILATVISSLLLVMILLPVLTALVLNIEGVQNFAVRKAGEIISKSIGTTVSIGKVTIRGYNRLSAKDFYVEDLRGDTLIYARDLSANISKSALLKKDIVIGDVTLDNACIYLYQPPEGKMNLSQIIDNISNPDKEKARKEIVLRDIFMTNTTFRYRNERQKEGRERRSERKKKGAIDFSDMDLSNMTLGCHNLVIAGNDISMRLYGLSFTEKSGFRLNLLETSAFHIGDGILDFYGLRIITPDTDLDFPVLEMRGNSWEDFRDFEDKVRFNARSSNSRLYFGTLGYFAPSLMGTDIILEDLTFIMNGPVNDFGGRMERIRSGGTRLALDYKIKNVARASDFPFDFDISSLTTEGSAVTGILEKLSAKPLDSALVQVLANAGEIDLAGRFTGTFTSFETTAQINTSAGGISLDGATGILKGGGISFDGDLGLSSVAAGRLLDISSLGNVSLSSRSYIHMKDNDVALRTSMRITELGFNGYTYRRLGVNGRMENGRIAAVVSASDPALRFSLRGSADISGEIPELDVDLRLDRADLASMNVIKSDSSAVVKGKFIARLLGSSLDDLNGSATITDLSYTTPADSLRADSIVVRGENSLSRKYLALASPYADAQFSSEMSYKDVFDYLRHIVFDYLPALSASGEVPHTKLPDLADSVSSSSYFRFETKNTEDVSRIFFPGLSLANGTKVALDFNPRTEKFKLEAGSDYIEYDKYFITRLKLTGDNASPVDSLYLNFTTEDIFIPGIVVPSTEFHAGAKDNKAYITARLSDSTTGVSAELDLNAILGRDQDGKLIVKGGFNPSTLVTNGQKWGVSSSEIVYTEERISISDFRINNNGQELYADGVISGDRADTLHVSLNQVSLEVLAGFTRVSGYVPQGYLTGHADLISVMKQPFIVADIQMLDLSLNEFTAPPMHFSSVWDFAGERARMILTDTKGGKDVIRGYYRPSDGAFMADVDMLNIPLPLADPLITGAVEDTRGTADLKLNLRQDTRGKPVLNGYIDINELTTTVDFTKTAFTLPQTRITVTDNIATLPVTRITDQEKGEAQAEGTLNLSNLSNITYDVRLQPRRLLAVNTTIRDNPSFYGKIYTSGSIHMRGDKLGIDINAVISTDENSSIYVPLSGNSQVAAADFITYESKVSDQDETDQLSVKKLKYRRQTEARENTGQADFNINAALTVTPATLLELVIDPTRNDALEARGYASLDVRFNPRRNDLSVVGTYEITEGDYLFNFQNIIANKLFVIQPGSTIQFSGDPLDALLNIEAIYSLRASVASVISGNENASSGEGDNPLDKYSRGRVPVDCIIVIGDRLSHPEITFDVIVQTSDTNLQAMLNSILNSQEDKAMQFIWLVAFNNFMSENMSMNSTAGTSLGIDFVTSQLNSLFSNITDDATINIRYRPQDGINSDEVDFGFTKEFLDRRLILEYEGNYDAGYESSASPYKTPLSNDLSLTALLNETGNVRMKVFTRSIDRFYELQGLQESGVGIYYREDFNTFKDIGERIRNRAAVNKRRRQQRRLERAIKAGIPPEEELMEGVEQRGEEFETLPDTVLDAAPGE